MVQAEVMQVYGLTPQDVIKPIEYIKALLEEIREIVTPTTERFLSRKDVADMFGISLGTVNNWTKSGRLQSYGKGRRVYYKSSEVENALVELKR